MKTARRVFCALGVLAAAGGAFGQAARVNRFAAEYMSMPPARLRARMAEDVPTRRRYLAEALAAKGAGAWPVVKPALKDKDWRVQCCAIESLVVTLEPHQASNAPKAVAARGELVKRMDGVIPALQGCLGASEYWVRCRAAVALGMFRQQAGPAAAALAAAADDESWWVRQAAVEALQQVTDKPALQVEGARNAMRRPCTSYAVLRQCMEVLRKHRPADPGVIDALLFQVGNPGQGMWSAATASALTVLAESNVPPDKLLPLLARVLTDPAYLPLQGDPRKAACQALAKLGPKARGALPALRKALTIEKQFLRDGKRKKAESLVELLEGTIEAIEKPQR